MNELFSKLGQKLSSWVGDKTTFGVSSHHSSVSHVNEVINYQALSSLLPYESYDTATGLFHNKQSQGFVLEAYPLNGSNEEIENILWGILTDVLPENADIHFLLYASPKIGNLLKKFEKERSGHGRIFEWLAQKRIHFLKKGAHESLNKHDSFILRNFRLIISGSMQKKKDEDLSDVLISFREDLMSSLKSIHMPSYTLSATEFINFMYDLAHPSQQIEPAEEQWNPHDSIALQLNDPENFIRVEKDRLIFENSDNVTEARAFSVKDFPVHMAQWKMTESIGQLFNTSLQNPCPFVISLSARLMPLEQGGMSDSLKSESKKKDAHTQGAEGKTKVANEYKDKIFANHRLSEGDRLMKTHYQVIMFSTPSQANSAERKIRDLYRVNGWKIKKTRHLQLQSYFAMFPMIMSEGMFDDLKLMGRLRTITAFNVAMIAPVQGENKGTESASMILPGRRGQLATWNPFDNKEGNFNVAVAAASGKGKSAFVQEYIVSLLSAGGRVWVIDIGRSYEKTCKLLGGTFIEFSPTSDININPFTHIKDFDEALGLLKPLLSMMARPDGGISAEENSYLEKALKHAWSEKGCDTTITTIANWLDQQESVVCRNLSLLLYSFTANGMYGRYFEGQSTIDLSKSFVVLELQDLNTKKDLQRIVMLVLMYHIKGAMFLGRRDQIKSLVLEEVWQHFDKSNSSSDDFIQAFARTVRRFKGNLVCIGQSINDYFSNSTMVAVYENSDFKVILGQNTEAIDQIKKSEKLSMDAFTERLFKSLRKTDEYSECIIKSSSGLSVHRIIFDPYFRILSSSKGDEYEAVKSWEAKGLPLEKAIEKVAEKFYA